MASTEYRLRDLSQTCSDHLTLPIKDRQGASYCFNCIVTAFQGQAYSVACRILYDRHLAEDAVQESLAAAYRSFGQFRGQNLRGWLMQIVANNCRDMLRASRSRPSFPLDPVAVDRESGDRNSAASLLHSNLHSYMESPEDFAERRELRRTIEAGLDSLADERRLAIILVDVEGFSYEEAAATMNCSVGTVKSRISRGRRELREILRGAGELLPSPFRQ